MIYERIKDLRYWKRLKQEEIAKELGMPQTTYSNYEIGKRGIPIEILSKLADYHNTSVDYILERTNEKKPYPPIDDD